MMSFGNNHMGFKPIEMAMTADKHHIRSDAKAISKSLAPKINMDKKLNTRPN